MAYMIVGCGYTGRYVASSLAQRGEQVFATTREPYRLEALAARGVTVLPITAGDALPADLPPDLRVLHSIPPVAVAGKLMDPTPWVITALAGRAARIVYLSSTGVYGNQAEVDVATPPAPATGPRR